MTPSTRASMPWAAVFVLVGLALASTAARANDPAVKDLLGKAQTQSETKAVEDLIDKLKRRQPPAARPATPAGTEPDTAAKVPPTPAKPSAPEAPAKEAAPAKGDSAVAPATIASGAETGQMPSIDLEVLFEYNSARIAPAAVATLTTLGRALSDERLAGDSFLIAGHTDAKGGADYNLRLSQQRAESVRRFLLENFSIAEPRLLAQGFGQKRLKDPANPLAALNRRVQIVNFTPPKAP